MKRLYYLFAFALTLFHFNGFAQEITEIPDAIFEQFLIDEGIDTDGEVNGQILTADAESVTKLIINGGNFEYIYGDYIQDLAGIQAFVNLDTLSVNATLITELPLNTLTELKYLDCSNNSLEVLDLSNNTELEDIIALEDGHNWPFVNSIDHLDLTNNPNIKYIYSNILGGFDLRNGNNHAEMTLILDPPFEFDFDPYGICIAVDDPIAATAQEYPYNEWNLGSFANYWLDHITFTDDLVACRLGVGKQAKLQITVYPNPAAEFIYFDAIDQNLNVDLFDMSGRKIKSGKVSADQSALHIADLAEGIYFYRLSTEGMETQSGKIIKK